MCNNIIYKVVDFLEVPTFLCLVEKMLFSYEYGKHISPEVIDILLHSPQVYNFEY